jgi:hypothetical protein
MFIQLLRWLLPYTDEEAAQEVLKEAVGQVPALCAKAGLGRVSAQDMAQSWRTKHQRRSL